MYMVTFEVQHRSSENKIKSCGPFGTSWKISEPSCPIFRDLGPTLGDLGHLGAHLGRSWAVLGTSWGFKNGRVTL